MYGDTAKTVESKSFANNEQLILSRLEFDGQETYHKIKDFLTTYKEKVTDVEKKDFTLQAKTKNKVFDFENRLTREKGIVSRDYVLLWLLNNVLLDSTLPDIRERKTYKFDEDGYIAGEIMKEFAVPDENLK